MVETNEFVEDKPFAFVPGTHAYRQRRNTVEARVQQHAQELAARQSRLDPVAHPPKEELKDLLPPEFCLEHRVYPWDTLPGATLVATSQTGDLNQLREMLEGWIGPVVLGNAAEGDVLAAIAREHEKELVQLAETQVPDDLSCRDINRLTWRRGLAASLFFGVSLALIFIYPRAFFIGVTLAALANLGASLIFKTAVFFAGYRKPPGDPVAVPMDAYPVVSLLIPMFNEAKIAKDLVQRLSRLSYPKSLLDIVIVVEADDLTTREALTRLSLPSWMRLVPVPEGQIKTKPRALNYALKFTRGDIIGILDAEDAPATDQIERVVEAFQIAPPTVACVQGILDFYNPQANWISRCFTIEYATWFRVVLAGAARLGFSIPLGGTTVYLRRAALNHVGGWDAHNVTEDADLGVRLARYGYKTWLIPTVTREEANHRFRPWVKQRSRWLKGYIATYIVHMRRPFRLLRDMGAWKFLGFQCFFLTTILQFTLAPALWCFWLVFFGIPTPFTEAMPTGWTEGLLALFLLSELGSLLIGFVAVGRTQHNRLMQWVPMMMFYFPMGVFAVYKAWAELVLRPFHWHKTPHGVSGPDQIGGDIHATVK